MSDTAGLLPTMHPCRGGPTGPVSFRQNHLETAARLGPHWPASEMPLGAMGLLGVAPGVIRRVVADPAAADDMIKLRGQLQAVLFKRRALMPLGSLAATARSAAAHGDAAVAKVMTRPMKQTARQRAWVAAFRYMASLGGSLDEFAGWLEDDAPSAGQGAGAEEGELRIAV